MKFGPVPLAEAAGHILAHSVPLPRGRLRKGIALGPDELDRLREAGVTEVTVARMEPGDLAEDAAAQELASSLAQGADGLRLSAAATGRVNIYATRPGITDLDVAALLAVNGVNPMITVASLPNHMRVDAGTMVATIKIISYAVPAADLDRVAVLGRGAIAQRVPIYSSATLIETTLGNDVSGKGQAAMQARLTRLGAGLVETRHVPHEPEPLAEAISAAQGEVVFILTASATSDPADVGPGALQRAGGTLIQFGMPVDPGNLLFLGSIGERPVIGLPGCARSPALNGADWVLERVFCGVDVTPADFAAMGVGGLLKEIPTRPKPRGDIDPAWDGSQKGDAAE